MTGEKIRIARGSRPLPWPDAVAYAIIYGLFSSHYCIWKTTWPIEISIVCGLLVILLSLATWHIENRISGGPAFGGLGFMFMPMPQVLAMTIHKDVPPAWGVLAILALLDLPAIGLLSYWVRWRRAQEARVLPLMYDAATDGYSMGSLESRGRPE